MAIKKYTATKDNTITNAFKQNLITRGTGSNMGASDVTEIFSIYGQALVQGTTTDAGKQTQELSRVLYQFPVSGTTAGEIKNDRTNGDIPISGNVNFYLKIFNAADATIRCSIHNSSRISILERRNRASYGRIH